MAIENLKKHLILSLKILYIAFWQYLDTPKFFFKKRTLNKSLRGRRKDRRTQRTTYPNTRGSRLRFSQCLFPWQLLRCCKCNLFSSSFKREFFFLLFGILLLLLELVVTRACKAQTVLEILIN